MKEKNIEKKEEVENESKEIKRPWQGVILLIIRSIILVVSLFIIFSIMLSGASGKHACAFFIFFTILFLVNIFLVVGIFMKRKMFFTFSIISSFIFLLTNFLWLVSSYYLYENINEISYNVFNNLAKRWFIVLLFNGFLIYLAVKCLKHPFYNQKKVEQKS